MKFQESNRLSLTGTLYRIDYQGSALHEGPASQIFQLNMRDHEENIVNLKQQMDKMFVETEMLRQKLSKEQELTFILKGYFHKIQKLMYHEQTKIFENPLNYEELQLHFRELLRRLQDVQCNRLIAPPKIYKKGTVKVYRVIQKAQGKD